MPRTTDAQPVGEAMPTRDMPPPRIEPDSDALFLDIDGTLAPIELRPEDVRPDARRTRALEVLSARLAGRVAVVTGRTISEADRILDGACMVVAGVHGLTLRCLNGELRETKASPGLDWAMKQAKAFADERPGLIVEDKGAGLTLHYRQAPDRADEVIAFGQLLARRTLLRGQPGDMVFEIRETQADKGSAVATLMQMPPFRAARPIFVGDDLTDEDGFRAVQAHGGYGVLVGDRETTDALYRLSDVEAVLRWLEDLD